MVTFDTELGRCAVRWSEAGISGVLLPRPAGGQGPPSRTASACPRSCAEAIEGIVAVMAGEARDLRDVPLDERGIDDLRRAVYAATREIPPGSTRSYGEVARAMGRPRRRPGRRRGARAQPVPDHRSVPPGRRGERGTPRVLGPGRPRDEAPDARARGRAGLRPAGAVRLTLLSVSEPALEVAAVHDAQNENDAILLSFVADDPVVTDPQPVE